MPELNPYARFLHAGSDGRTVDAILASTANRLSELTEAIGEARMTTPPAAGKWTPAEILCHLADCEIAFGFRLRQTLAQDPACGAHVIQPFDQDRWAASYTSVTAPQALAAFTALRDWNLILIRNAPPSAAGKPVTHPERGAMTFATILETMAGHDLNHLQQLEKLAAVAPAS
jgi:DinB superfamily